MGKSKDLATGASYVDTAGDTMTGELVNDSIYLTNDVGQKLFMYRDGNIKYGLELQASNFRVFAEDQAAINLGHTARSDGSTFTSRLGIDSSGRVTMPYQPMFHAWCTDGGNSAVSGGSSPTSFYASLNVGSHFSSGTFTAPIAGKYRFYASILMGAGNGGYGLYQFTVNNSGSFGGGINNNWGQGYNYGTANDKNITRELIVDLAANDYVKLQVNGTNANLYWAGGYSYFGGHLIG